MTNEMHQAVIRELFNSFDKMDILEAIEKGLTLSHDYHWYLFHIKDNVEYDTDGMDYKTLDTIKKELKGVLIVKVASMIELEKHCARKGNE